MTEEDNGNITSRRNEFNYYINLPLPASGVCRQARVQEPVLLSQKLSADQ